MTREKYQRDYRQSYKDQAKRVNLTFAMPEYRDISRTASRLGIPLASYVKRLALDAHRGRQEAPEEIAEQLAELERLVRTIANNVNQMARHSNRISHVLDEQEVFLHIAQLQQELRRTITQAASTPPKSDDPSSDRGGA